MAAKYAEMSDETSRLITSDGGGRNIKQVFEQWLQPCLAEMIGVMLFVFVGSMAVQDGRHAPIGPPVAIAVAVTSGLIIAALVAGLWHISGGHVNPAATLAIALAGGISPFLAIGYVISQLFGGILGAAACRGVLSYTVLSGGQNITAYAAIKGGAQNLSPGVTPAMGIMCEASLTLVLDVIVIMTAVDTKGKSVILAPLAIGFTVCAAILAGINVSGASMNPARTFGPAVMMTGFDSSIWQYHYVYWVGPAIGACLAALLFRLVLAGPDKRLILKED